MLLTRQQLGSRGEELAAEYLMSCGYLIVEHRFRIREGEIDLVCRKEGHLIFVEVKARTSGEFGNLDETISQKKLRRMTRVAHAYLTLYNRSNVPQRFGFRLDVVGLRLSPNGALLGLEHFRDITL